MLAEFDRNGQCLLSFQRSDYEGLESPSQIWLYKNKADLLSKAKSDQVVNFSLASASYAGEEPSADVNLHYNGSSLTYISTADPYHTGNVLEKFV